MNKENGIPSYPDKYFDLAIVDTNYGIGESNSNFDSRNRPVKQKNGSFLLAPNKNYKRKDWDLERPNKKYFEELFRVSKHRIIWGYNYLSDLMPEFSAGRIIWDKCNGDNDFSDCEIAGTNLFNSVRLFRYMWAGMFQGKSINEGWIQQGNKQLNEERIHPTQKPIALYKWLLSNYAKPNDKILDTHVGSASSLIACEDMGFEYVGFELDEQYYNDAKKRLAQFRSQLKLAI